MGLLGGIARTAVAAGTWTAVSNRVSRRQYDRWSEQADAQAYQQQQAYPQQQAYQQPAPAQGDGGRDRIQQLEDLGELRAQGVLTEEEFAAQKARLLAA